MLERKNKINLIQDPEDEEEYVLSSKDGETSETRSTIEAQYPNDFVLVLDSSVEYHKMIIGSAREKIWKIVNKIKQKRREGKVVYQGEDENNGCVINPETSNFKAVFDAVIEILIFVDLILSPIEYFVLSYKTASFLRPLTFDFFFVLEIVLNFFTAFFDSENKTYIKDKRLIAVYYLKSSFALHFIYCCPLYFLYDKLAIMRAVKLYRYPGIISKFKSLLIKLATRVFKNYSAVSQILSILTFFISLCLILHWWACAYCFLGLYIYDESWVNQHKDIFSDTNYIDIYISGYYFITETFTSTGFGDLTPVKDLEFLYIIMCQIITCGIYAYLLSNILSILTSKSKKLSFTLRNNLQNFQRWKNFFLNKLPSSSKRSNVHREDVWVKSKKLFEIYYDGAHNFEWMRERDFLIQMKPRERNELLGKCLGPFFEKFNSFFSHIPKISTKISIVSNLTSTVETPGAKVDFFPEKKRVFFVVKGKVDVRVEGELKATFREGEFFGVEGLFGAEFDGKIEYFVNEECKFAVLFWIGIDMLIKDILNYDGEALSNVQKIGKSFVCNKLKISKRGETNVEELTIDNKNLGDLYLLEEELEELNKGFEVLELNRRKIRLIQEQSRFMKKYLVT